MISISTGAGPTWTATAPALPHYTAGPNPAHAAGATALVLLLETLRSRGATPRFSREESCQGDHTASGSSGLTEQNRTSAHVKKQG